MKTKINRWGNSLAIRIPNGIIHDAELFDGQSLDIERKGKEIILSPSKRTAYDLKALLSQVNEENLHGEIETDGPVGNEAW